MSATEINFPDKMRLRVPAGLPEAVRRAARRNHTSSSEWARQALLKGLAQEGVYLSDAQLDGEGPRSK